jgi:ABC-2 type transport system ATP-binding protein
MEPIIKVSSLTKKYGDFTAVSKLNLSINKGEVFGLLGPNGAGKSTTILMMLGLTEPSKGRIDICGYNPEFEPLKVKQKVGYLPEDVGFYDDFSGLENLIYTAKLNNLTKEIARKKAIALLEKVGLGKELDKKVGKYSRGMRQRLGLADVLIKEPEVIILDEPTLGIDPKGINDFLNLIIELSKEQKITVLFSSHHLYQVQQVCDRVGIFVQGKLLAEGNIELLAKSLFNVNNFVVEGEVAELPNRQGSAFNDNLPKLEETLKSIDSVSQVVVHNTNFTVESASDVTALISKQVIDLEMGLARLNRKVYGLDDIYHRYFQGVE